MIDIQLIQEGDYTAKRKGLNILKKN